jgi:hypothetical protein
LVAGNQKATHSSALTPLAITDPIYLTMSVDEEVSMDTHCWNEAWDYARRYGLCKDFRMDNPDRFLSEPNALQGPMTEPTDFLRDISTPDYLNESLTVGKASILLLGKAITPVEEPDSFLKISLDVLQKLETPLLQWDSEMDIIKIRTGRPLGFEKSMGEIVSRHRADMADIHDLELNDSRLQKIDTNVQQEKLAITKPCLDFLVSVLNEEISPEVVVYETPHLVSS